jgi:hypothetical protein
LLVLSRKSLCKPASNKMSKHRKISKHELLVIIVPLVGLALVGRPTPADKATKNS